jgi:hypothetical protein
MSAETLHREEGGRLAALFINSGMPRVYPSVNIDVWGFRRAEWEGCASGAEPNPGEAGS